MEFFHCTTNKSGRKILGFKKPTQFTPAFFEVLSCLQYWLAFISKGEGKVLQGNQLSFPRTYYYEGTNEKVHWLGEGLYCFSNGNRLESPLYAKKHGLDVILQVNYAEECTHFDLHENKEGLQHFLRNEFLPRYISIMGNDSEKIRALKALVELLCIEIEDEYFLNPHSAAIVLELYIFISNLEFDVVSNKFLKLLSPLKYDNYHCIRNLDLISNFEYNKELSHMIRM